MYWKLIGVLLIVVSCKSVHRQTLKQSVVYTNYLTAVIQDGKTTNLEAGNNVISLKRSLFSLRFRGKQYDKENKLFHSVRFAVIRKKQDFEAIQVGMNAGENKFFGPGTGMAGYQDKSYSQIYFAKYGGGHHYIFYENEGHRRADLIENRGEYLWLGWENIPVSNLDADLYYFVVWADDNLNNILDEEEVLKLEVRFK